MKHVQMEGTIPVLSMTQPVIFCECYQSATVNGLSLRYSPALMYHVSGIK
jgi:hypothetical protein